ncbi:PAS domain S-box protein [uncultured Methanoregula sp.]|uniref:PAS domain S-box protein n=1 Tax=uncultured Methanoregula sp. TaxID=1005933 RepID=UPI002AAAED62|nr:PAS domain S-box protein [uncultured Methanoregula sp.]
MEQDRQAWAKGKNEHMFRDLIESIGQRYFTLDDQENVTYMSPACEEIFGVLPGALIGKPITSIVIPAEKDRVSNKYREVKAGGFYPSDYRVLDKCGNIHVVRCISRSYTGDDGKKVIAGIISEISREQTAEEALRTSEEKVKKIINYSRDGIILADEKGILIEWSPAMEQITGIPRSGAVGRPVWDLQYEMLPGKEKNAQSRSRIINHFHALLGAGEPEPVDLRQEYEIERPDMTHSTIESIQFLVPTEGGTMVAAIVRDITDRKKIEDTLMEANRQLGLMTSITRHDINNKIMTMLGYFEVAKEECKDPVLREYIRKLASATESIKTQIAFTKIYQDLGSQKPQWQDICSILPRSHIPENVIMTADVQGVSVFADPMLERVFFNLLDNTLRHGHRVTKISVSYRMSGVGLILLWEDNGEGVAAGYKEKIFERGFGRNNGLGLFLVREILSLTGITIQETGEPGRGARFEIKVPDGAFRIGGRQ